MNKQKPILGLRENLRLLGWQYYVVFGFTIVMTTIGYTHLVVNELVVPKGFSASRVIFGEIKQDVPTITEPANRWDCSVAF